MTDVVPGTMVQMRIARRYSHYNVGDLIAVDFWAARELDAKRLAQPLGLLVPTPPPAETDGPPTPASAVPRGGQSGAVVRK